MNPQHHVFIWSPYQGKSGDKKFIDMHLGSIKEALDLAYDNRHKWRRDYGEGQVIVATVSTYMGLH